MLKFMMTMCILLSKHLPRIAKHKPDDPRGVVRGQCPPVPQGVDSSVIRNERIVQQS